MKSEIFSHDYNHHGNEKPNKTTEIEKSICTLSDKFNKLDSNGKNQVLNLVYNFLFEDNDEALEQIKMETNEGVVFFLKGIIKDVRKHDLRMRLQLDKFLTTRKNNDFSKLLDRYEKVNTKNHKIVNVSEEELKRNTRVKGLGIATTTVLDMAVMNDQDLFIRKVYRAKG